MQNGEENNPGELAMSRSADVLLLLPHNGFANSVLGGTGEPPFSPVSVPGSVCEQVNQEGLS